MKTLYWITNETSVDARFQRELANANPDSQQRPDSAVWLFAAPEIGANRPSAIIYIATNGDPIYIGALGADGWAHITEDIDENGDPIWLTGLGYFDFIGDTETEAREFVEGLMVDVGMIE